MKLKVPSSANCYPYMFYLRPPPPKTQNAIDETASLRTQSVTHASLTPRKLNFRSNSKCHSCISHSPKTQLPFEFKVSLIHLLLPKTQNAMNEFIFASNSNVSHTSFTPRKLKMEWLNLNFPSNSKCHSYIFYPLKLKMESMSLNFPSNSDVSHTSFTFRKLKMEWLKLNFPSNSECHSYIFYPPKTQNGIDVTQLPLNSKCQSYIFYSPKTQNGMVETQLHFELKVSLIHLLPPEN